VRRPDSDAADRVRAHDDVLGYLLKHAHRALEQRAEAALADTGLTVRDLGVLRVIAGGEAESQQEVAAVLGIDPTSMVALLDALEHRGIVVRRPSERDRRRNIIELTGHGRAVFRQAEDRYAEAEKAFTSSLGDSGAAGLRRALRSVLDNAKDGITWSSLPRPPDRYASTAADPVISIALGMLWLNVRLRGSPAAIGGEVVAIVLMITGIYITASRSR
jgi:DNA-binding MarR family transcriptional regulator